MTIQQAFGIALQHHQSGRLAEAEAIYRQILAVQPGHADALHLLGVIAYQAGRSKVAEDLIRQAIAVTPNFSAAYDNLGTVLRNQGRADEAIVAHRHSASLASGVPETYYNLGNALKDKGSLDEAVAAYRQAIAIKPDYVEAHCNLGNALRNTGRLDEAIAVYRRAVAFGPDDAEAHSNLGNALRDAGQLDEAIAVYRRAIVLKPDYAEAHSNLGNALKDIEELDEALSNYRKAVTLRPNYAEGHNNLGAALQCNGQLDEAIAACCRAIALRPNYPEAYINLGAALNDKGQLDEAIAACRRSVALRPDYAEAHNNLGSTLKDRGQLDEAITAYRQAIDLKPDFPEARSNLLFTLHYHPGFDARAIAEEHGRWNIRHGKQPGGVHQSHPNDRDPERRLRVGYVSPDIREHPVGRNMLPLFTRHNHDSHETYCYAQVARADALTERFRAAAHHWRGTVGLGDEEFAAQVRADRIDVLVDLALHTSGNRLPVFARKPAPVQVTFAGYPGSTGLKAIDYRLSDPYLDPPGMDESIYSEHTVRLPHTFWCYDPLDAGDISVGALPARTAGHVTFGCLNNHCKVNGSVLGLWAKVLQAVPSSRLLLLAPGGSARARIFEQFEQRGVPRERIGFCSRRPHREYLEIYHQIDIGLDTIPYNGHTTSLDSLWMGVPVVTLAGQTIVGRAGLSQLMNLGLPELIANTEDGYVKAAAGLAEDLPRLTRYRMSLRERMSNSPLMDAERYTRDIEAAFREMWRAWCAESNPPP